MKIAANCPQLYVKKADGIAVLTRNVLRNMDADLYYPPWIFPYRPMALASWYGWSLTGLSAWLNMVKPDV